ncbi:MAG: hypothetical protein HOO67_02325 [Candidatus Peribacteraceae bacterium]|nr:hypothetical protein [Candidatus Peribacteraceae bacterium]
MSPTKVPQEAIRRYVKSPNGMKTRAHVEEHILDKVDSIREGKTRQIRMRINPSVPPAIEKIILVMGNVLAKKILADAGLDAVPFRLEKSDGENAFASEAESDGPTTPVLQVSSPVEDVTADFDTADAAAELLIEQDATVVGRSANDEQPVALVEEGPKTALSAKNGKPVQTDKAADAAKNAIDKMRRKK